MANYTVATLSEFTDSLSRSGRHLAKESSGRLWASYVKVVSTYTQVHCAYSDDNGKTWTAEQATSSSYSHSNAVIAIDSNDDLHLVYRAPGYAPDTAKGSIVYMKKTSGVWGSEEVVASKSGTWGNQYNPTLALDSSDDVHVGWAGFGWGTYTTKRSIQYRKRESTVWQAVEEIANPDAQQEVPDITVDASGNVHVVWGGGGWGVYTARFNIQYRKRTSSWQTQEAITDVDANQRYPSIALDSSDDIHVFWFSTSGAFYRKRTTSWQTQETVNSGAGNTYTTIAIDTSDNVLVVYAHNSLGIQYKKRVSSWSDAISVKEMGAGNYEGCSLLWAKHPTVSDIRTNVPSRPYVIWEENESEVFFGDPLQPPVTVDETIAEPTVVLEAIRNIEVVYGGRVFIDKSGNFTYETRYTRNV